MSEKPLLNAPVPRTEGRLGLPAVVDWRPARVGFYWLLGVLTYLILWGTLGPDALKALFLYLAPKP